MNAIVAEGVKSGVLDEDIHARLIQNIDRIAKGANVPMPVICKSAKTVCSAAELEYLRDLRTKVNDGVYGLMFVGKKTKSEGAEISVSVRMLAIAGACLRNFIDAKVMAVQTVFEDLKAGRMEEPTVLLIPNFYAAKEAGGSLPDWQISQLLGLLYARQGAGKQTFVFVSDMDDLQKDYGAMFRTHLESCFEVVPA